MSKQLTLAMLHEQTNDAAVSPFSKKQRQEIQCALAKALVAFGKTREQDKQYEENEDKQYEENEDKQYKENEDEERKD